MLQLLPRVFVWCIQSNLSFIIIDPPEPKAVRLDEWGLKAWSTHPGRFRDRTANGFIRWTTYTSRGPVTHHLAAENCSKLPRAIRSDGAARPLSQAQRLLRSVTVAALPVSRSASLCRVPGDNGPRDNSRCRSGRVGRGAVRSGRRRVRASRRQLPIQRSAVPFCQGLRKDVRTGLVPIDLMNSTTAALKIESRSKTRYRGAVSYGSALRSC